MSEGKQERQRRKRAEARRKKAREQAEQAKAEARLWRSYALADRADDRLDEDRPAEALEDARRAAALNPGDPEIVHLYLAAAERAHDLAEQARALGRLVEIATPDARLFARLAYLRLQTGDAERAGKAARRARSLLPPRMKDRKTWVALLDHVEEGATALARKESAGHGRGRTPSAPQERAKGSSRAPAGGKAPRKSMGPPAAEPGVKSERRDARSAGTGVGPPRTDAASPDTQVEPPHADAGAPEPHVKPPTAEPEVPEPPAPLPPFEIAVEIAPQVDGLEILTAASFSDPEDVALAILAARIRDAESYEGLLALERAQGLLRFSHQEDTARKVLSVFLGRALLADEVGLGKTIEAGLILSEYLLRGSVERALVLAPPSLVSQWREELSSKFSIEVRTTEDAAFRSDPERFWSGDGVAVASLATARSAKQRDVVTAAPWDLVIVDEAHVLKNAATESYALVSRLTSRFLLLLTATPVENRIEELYNLVSLLRPGQLGGRAAFLRRFSDAKVRRSEAARAEVRALLGEVMVRNTRALSGVRLPPRFARTVLVQPSPAEGELYGHLADALRALGPGGRSRLLLSVLLQEAGSSPFAVLPTLEKIRANPEQPPAVVEALGPAMRAAERPIATGKAQALLRVLDGAGEQAVVFTRFRATLGFLAATLERAGIPHEAIDGNVPAPRRSEAIERLRRGGGVLLSTEVGAEGLNLQFCRRIVNFDLPWNPMRIEQRIGRVHRIGQDHAVDVVNLCLAGSIEERILTILDERINLFELVVGEAEMILGYLEDERDFPDLMLDAFSDPDAEGRERSFTRIGDQLATARTRYENVKRFDEDFFRNELGA